LKKTVGQVSLTMVLYASPFGQRAVKFNRPTSPAQVPLQLATVDRARWVKAQAGGAGCTADRFGDDERRMGSQLAETSSAIFLRIDERVLLAGSNSCTGDDLPALRLARLSELFSIFACAGQHFWWRRAANPIGYQISVEGFERRLILQMTGKIGNSGQRISD